MIEKSGLDCKMKIFLDDVRDPPDNTWVVVRSYDQFVDLISTTPHIVTEISFDHDLGMEPDGKSEAKSGMDAAKTFIEMSMDNPRLGQLLEKVSVHSANPSGGDNIAGYFKSAVKHEVLNPSISIVR